MALTQPNNMQKWNKKIINLLQYYFSKLRKMSFSTGQLRSATGLLRYAGYRPSERC